MKKLFTYLLILLISLSYACQQPIKYVGKSSSLPIDSNLLIHESTQKLIEPYKAKLDSEMNEILIISSEEFPKERGKPETKLGNLIADLCFNYTAYNLYKEGAINKPEFCLLNFGGLRTSLPKGEITRGKTFELMPFENELVLVHISYENFNKFLDYIKKVGGQPVSGISLRYGANGFLENQIYNRPAGDIDKEYVILTTDYLANGGDNMTFFSSPIKYEETGIKLRNAIIEYFIEQHKQGKQLSGKLDGRITFE